MKAIEAGHRALFLTLDICVSRLKRAQAENRLSEAELEYAKTKEERVRILRERVRMFRAVEFTQKDQVNAGTGDALQYLIAKSERLDAEIELLEEENSE